MIFFDDKEEVEEAIKENPEQMAFLRESSSVKSLDPYYLVPEKTTNKTVNMGIMDPKYIRK